MYSVPLLQLEFFLFVPVDLNFVAVEIFVMLFRFKLFMVAVDELCSYLWIFMYSFGVCIEYCVIVVLWDEKEWYRVGAFLIFDGNGEYTKTVR